jgi:hypothetical protein
MDIDAYKLISLHSALSIVIDYKALYMVIDTVRDMDKATNNPQYIVRKAHDIACCISNDYS